MSTKRHMACHETKVSLSLREVVADHLMSADIRLDGGRPWDPTIHDERVFQRFFAEGRLGLGEAYVEGLWDCDALDELIYRALTHEFYDKTSRWKLAVPLLRAKLFNPQRRARAREVAEAHYDLDNDLFRAMLDSRLVYSCAYWKEADNLETAQVRKLDLVCRKIGLQPGMTVLDIGCGFGSFARYAAENYAAEVVGITVSKEQLALAQQHCAGLPVDLRLQDYREIDGTFDRVVSIGMFEHVGYKNYRMFMEVVRRALKNDNSLFLLHTIGGRKRVAIQDRWIEKYIFPNYALPTIQHIGAAAQDLFTIEDWHNFGNDYHKTLMAWWRNFDEHWPALQAKYDERFYRLWRYYLQFCAGVFRARYNQVWQIVLSPKGVDGGYASIR